MFAWIKLAVLANRVFSSFVDANISLNVLDKINTPSLSVKNILQAAIIPPLKSKKELGQRLSAFAKLFISVGAFFSQCCTKLIKWMNI